MRIWNIAALLLAAGCLLRDALLHPLRPLAWTVLFALVPLLLITRSLPVCASRERPVTFTAPFVFALTLWFGPLLTGTAAWTAAWLFARFGSPIGSPRSRARASERQQGALFVLAGYAAASAMSWLDAQAGASGIDAAARQLSRLAAASVGALVFTGALAACHAVGHFQALRAGKNSAAERVHFSRLALVMTLGLLPVALLAPLEAVFGLSVGLPLLLLFLLSGRLASLHEETRSLRGQMQDSEEMGLASISNPDSIDDAVLLQRFLALAQKLVSAERSLIWIFDEETGVLSLKVALPDAGPFADCAALYGEGLIGHAATRLAPRLVEDAACDPHRLPSEHVYGAWLLYPIVVHGLLRGVAQWTRPVSRPFSQEDIARLASLVPQAAIALENVAIRARMRDLAATDGLTGLWNHRRMHDLLREEIYRAARYYRALSVLMMDVDSFKTFNDSYGHPQGDELLRVIAGILRRSVRNVDHVGRYGGEEFVIILPETSKDAACRLAERIRAEIEAKAFVMVEGQPIHRTLSIGVAAYPEDALSPAELMQRADEAMYRAKRGGKNRVTWA